VAASFVVALKVLRSPDPAEMQAMMEQGNEGAGMSREPVTDAA
jgi:hypothetical protein